MARFDVHTYRAGAGLLLNCQAGLLDHLNTRLAVPLLPPELAPRPAARLNPLFTVDGVDYLMVPQFTAAITLRDMGEKVGSLAGITVTVAKTPKYIREREGNGPRIQSAPNGSQQALPERLCPEANAFCSPPARGESKVSLAALS